MLVYSKDNWRVLAATEEHIMDKLLAVTHVHFLLSHHVAVGVRAYGLTMKSSI